MKKLLILLFLLLPLAAGAKTTGKTIRKADLTSIISEFRRYDGVEVVNLGRLGTAAVKAVARTAARKDPEMREALDLVRGVRKLTVLEYGDSASDVKERLNNRLRAALQGSDLLMEAKDGNSAMRIYGVVDDATGDVSNFVLHAPNDGALIFVSGTLSADMLGKIMSDD